MTEQDVFDTAREVCGKWPSFMSNPNLQAFAKRIAEKAVEGKVVMAPEEYKFVWDKAQAEEREACAKLMETMRPDLGKSNPYADAIRARGEA